MKNYFTVAGLVSSFLGSTTADDPDFLSLQQAFFSPLASPAQDFPSAPFLS